MEILIRFGQRHPPRIGWGLFFLGLVTALLLPSTVSSAELRLDVQPVLGAVLAGFLLAFLIGRGLRVLWVLPVLLVPFSLFDLLPPWRVVEADLRSLALAYWEAPSFVLPAALASAWEATNATLTQAWRGETRALTWTLARIIALLGYPSAAILALGLRRGQPPLVYSFPLLAAIIMTSMTAGTRTIYVLFAVLIIFLLCIVGAFRARERSWERTRYTFSDALRWDVGLIGLALLAVVTVFGAITPPVPFNPITTWLWTDVRLPAGLARLDKSEAAKDGGGSTTARVGNTRVGENLELGRSLEGGESTEIALTIRAPDIDPASLPYWRGQIYNRYDGRGWDTGRISSRNIDPIAILDTSMGLISQEVNDTRPGRRTLYGMPNIIASSAPATLESNPEGDTIAWTSDVASYTVYSRPPSPPSTNPADLIEIEDAIAPYRIVPPELPQRVIDLAEQVTADAQTQAQRAEAIETYLRGLRYSYEVAPLPPNGDAVDQFLFTMGQGYCTYYASAMAMMARAVGIPSRVAVGYATGDYDATTSTWTVRESDAHAWTELYFESEGWTRWEPTPIRPVPARSTTPALPQPQLVAQEDPAATTPTTNWGLIALSLVLVVGFVGFLWFGRRATPLNAGRVLLELHRYGRRAGIPPRMGDSIEEYTARLARAVPIVRLPIERVGRLLTARTYRRTPLDSEEEATLLRSWENARDMLPQQPTSSKH